MDNWELLALDFVITKSGSPSLHGSKRSNMVKKGNWIYNCWRVPDQYSFLIFLREKEHERLAAFLVGIWLTISVTLDSISANAAKSRQKVPTATATTTTTATPHFQMRASLNLPTFSRLLEARQLPSGTFVSTRARRFRGSAYVNLPSRSMYNTRFSSCRVI